MIRDKMLYDAVFAYDGQQSQLLRNLASALLDMHGLDRATQMADALPGAIRSAHVARQSYAALCRNVPLDKVPVPDGVMNTCQRGTNGGRIRTWLSVACVAYAVAVVAIVGPKAHGAAVAQAHEMGAW